MTNKINLTYLMRQRQAIERAILRARYYEDNGDVELLQSVVVLLDNLKEAADQLAERAKIKPTH